MERSGNVGLFGKHKKKKAPEDQNQQPVESAEATEEEDWDEELAREAMAAEEEEPERDSEPESEPEVEREPEPAPEAEPEPVQKKAAAPVEAPKKKRKGLLSGLFSVFSRVDEDFLEELEEQLILADAGVETAEAAVEALRQEKGLKGEAVRDRLVDILTEEMEKAGPPQLHLESKPSVIVMVGVNGVGKTTTIGKLAKYYKDQGKKVLLCAADTFRAAAAEQLTIWAQRTGADIVHHEEGSDPGAVVFDACHAAVARGSDLVIVDTAGRLHNKQNLMNELSKLTRIVSRELPEADCEVLLVLDATTGQNGLIQAQQFASAAGVTGIVLTKLDGTAKGGVVFSIAEKLGVPVKLVGVGESAEDLQVFHAREFAREMVQ